MEVSPHSLSQSPITASVQPNAEWMLSYEEQKPSLRDLVKSRLRGRGEHAVDDVLQEVAIAVQNAEGLAEIGEKGFAAWLRRVAIYKVNDHWRGAARREGLQSRYQDSASNEREMVGSPFEWVARIERSDLVTRELAALSEKDRRLLEMKYLQGLSYRDIAQTEGTTEKSIEYRLTQARKILRKKLFKLSIEKETKDER